MPGNVVFKPIEAHLTHDTELITKMDPYCAFIVGSQKFNSDVCKKGGKHPQWTDAVTVPVTSESTVTVNIMDKDTLTKDDLIGTFTLICKKSKPRSVSANGTLSSTRKSQLVKSWWLPLSKVLVQ